MAITWGGYNGHLRLGIDLTTSAATTGDVVTVYVKLYVQVDSSWNFDDTQSWRLNGTNGSSGSFNNTLSNGASKLLFSTQYYASVDYDGGPTYSYSASLSGAYNGAAPTHSRSITLPARQASAPSTPAAPNVGSITGTTAHLTWSAPATNGSAINGNAGQVSTSSGFGSILKSWEKTPWEGETVTGLPKGTTLYARVRVRNGVGWSGWSSGRSFTTLITVPSGPYPATFTEIKAESARMSWGVPADDGGAAITGYDINMAIDPEFTEAAGLFRVTSNSTVLTQLRPGTTYYVRQRAVNSAGTGDWSEVRSFTTESALFVGNGTTWVPALVWVGNGTSWVPCRVMVGNGTEWK
ncbi:fibronectin type III domain-containing protein [Catenuloplanes sp. NPDC051500]|uniref:fibronectin type III domain-containing protein n=1 Tax=Catenuloplanes sp. NPDC051500 TaxID=3363959 RepID=UPI0037BA9BB1